MDELNHDFMIVDDDGYTWYWDGERMYALYVDDPDDYVDVEFIHRKGYPAKTWKEAVNWLIVDGYITADCDDPNMPDESMDGDHESALASIGWGTDEDYGKFSDDFESDDGFYLSMDE